MNRDTYVSRMSIGPSYGYRPDRPLFSRGNERSIITSVYNNRGSSPFLYRTVDRTALAEEKPTGHSLVHFGPGLALEHPAALERL